eukprot:6236016-Amphidinium_carterae.1
MQLGKLINKHPTENQRAGSKAYSNVCRIRMESDELQAACACYRQQRTLAILAHCLVRPLREEDRWDVQALNQTCLLYTSDAADDTPC